MNSVEALLVWHEVVEEPRLLLNREGEVIWTNAAARAYAGRELLLDASNRSSGSIWQTAQVEEFVFQILKSATEVQPNRTVKIQIDNPKSKLREVKIIPFNSELQNLVGVTIPPAQKLDPSSLPRLRHVFGITKTEFKILNDILDGKSPSETAAEGGTSIFTVRTHIKNIYRKLSVSNRSSLLAKLNSYT